MLTFFYLSFQLLFFFHKLNIKNTLGVSQKLVKNKLIIED